jgi:AhpD family alkylhydroperoxidase
MVAFQDRDDFQFIPQLIGLAPVEARAFLAFNHAAERADGLIAPKYRELISLAVALTTQCAYCIDVHTKRAVQCGVTREELAETAMVAAAVRAGGTLGHSLLALRLFDEASREGAAADE